MAADAAGIQRGSVYLHGDRSLHYFNSILLTATWHERD